MTDEAGYLQGDLAALGELLGAPLDLIEDTLTVMQGFEPCGVFARDLRECLTLQLKEQDRCDPAMAALIEHLDLLAAHDLGALKRACRVSDEDLCDMIQEVKRLNPKPGLKYGSSPSQPKPSLQEQVSARPSGSFPLPPMDLQVPPSPRAKRAVAEREPANVGAGSDEKEV